MFYPNSAYRIYTPVDNSRNNSFENDNKFVFTVVNYNVLANYLVDPVLHEYQGLGNEACDLSWQIRGPRILSMIIQFNADIILLQEVDQFDYFVEALSHHGYTGQFLQRTGDKADGVATFFRKARFRLSKRHEIFYKRPDIHPYLNRDNVGLILELELRENSTEEDISEHSSHLKPSHTNETDTIYVQDSGSDNERPRENPATHGATTITNKRIASSSKSVEVVVIESESDLENGLSSEDEEEEEVVYSTRIPYAIKIASGASRKEKMQPLATEKAPMHPPAFEQEQRHPPALQQVQVQPPASDQRWPDVRTQEILQASNWSEGAHNRQLNEISGVMFHRDHRQKRTEHSENLKRKWFPPIHSWILRSYGLTLQAGSENTTVELGSDCVTMEQGEIYCPPNLQPQNEEIWDCLACSGKNWSFQIACHHCFATRIEKNDVWACVACEKRNWSFLTVCDFCSFPRTESQTTQPDQSWQCLKCSCRNPTPSPFCIMCSCPKSENKKLAEPVFNQQEAMDRLEEAKRTFEQIFGNDIEIGHMQNILTPELLAGLHNGHSMTISQQLMGMFPPATAQSKAVQDLVVLFQSHADQTYEAAKAKLFVEQSSPFVPKQVTLQPNAQLHNSWQCMRCSFCNPTSSPLCGMCALPQTEKPNAQLHDSWQCMRCSFRNPKSNLLCGMCTLPHTEEYIPDRNQNHDEFKHKTRAHKESENFNNHGKHQPQPQEHQPHVRQELKPQSTSRRLLVANTHLLFNPKRGDIKLAQLQLLIRQLEMLSSHNRGGSDFSIPIILGGDFNFTPQSALYFFIRNGFLRTLDLDRKILSGQYGIELGDYGCLDRWIFPNEQYIPHQGAGAALGFFWQERPQEWEHSRHAAHTKIPHAGPIPVLWDTADRKKNDSPDAVCEVQDIICHKLTLNSAYAAYSQWGDTGEPAYSTYHKEFKGTVDYLWFTPFHLKLINILEMPLKGSLERYQGLPSIDEPSDHLPLVSQFEYVENKNG